MVIGLLCVGETAFLVPPYQNPDEPNHFLRAEQISRLGILARRLPSGQIGGVSDIGILRTADLFRNLAIHPEIKVRGETYLAARTIFWRQGTYQAGFPNTALYPPAFYMPAAAGIALGKAAHLGIIQTLYVARVATGVAATTLAASAIFLAAETAAWTFAVLSLPMSLGLFAAVSQDGLLVGMAALGGALFSTNCRVTNKISLPRFGILCCALATLAASRPPYLPLAFLLLFLPGINLKGRIAAVAAVVATVVGWAILAASIGGIAVAQGDKSIVPAGQIAFLIRHPLYLGQLLFNTAATSGSGYLEQITGRLGSLDVALPNAFHDYAWAMLGVALVCAASGGLAIDRAARRRLSGVVLLILASALFIFLIQYATWTPVGAPRIEGVQGRYFLPLLLFVAGALSVSRLDGSLWPVPLIVATTIFPFVSVGVMIRMITIRYYVD